MKFDTRTLQILRNFSSINQSIIFKNGRKLRTISSSKSVFAEAEIPFEIEKLFAIYNLPQFLSAISLFENPELILGDSSVTIKSGKEKLSYVYSEPSLIMSPSDKTLTLPSIDIEFMLKSETLTKVQKALGVIGLPEIAIVGDGEKIYVTACNSKNSSESSYRIEVGETDLTFKLIFLAENVNLLPGDYEAKICSKGIAQFKGPEVCYWIMVESNSEFPS